MLTNTLSMITSLCVSSYDIFNHSNDCLCYTSHRKTKLSIYHKSRDKVGSDLSLGDLHVSNKEHTRILQIFPDTKSIFIFCPLTLALHHCILKTGIKSGITVLIFIHELMFKLSSKLTRLKTTKIKL